MAYISRYLRDQVTQRARGLCEYCQTARATVIEMEIDHIVPEKVSGQTILDNLCLACAGCNSFKRDFQDGIDPITGKAIPLYNPRTDVWNEHFAWDTQGTRVIGLTPTGRATIARLRMNRGWAVQARERWVRAGWHPPDKL